LFLLLLSVLILSLLFGREITEIRDVQNMEIDLGTKVGDVSDEKKEDIKLKKVADEM
jgi:hypothetical protein